MESKYPLETTALPASLKRLESKQLDTSTQPDAPKFLILVVDDSADSVAMPAWISSKRVIGLLPATNGEEAISVACCTQPNLILMDI